ncbi:MAG: hypothetical protein A2096_04820 [Spirochaetes bacterium GWF1_41_5]|nr:MAG: hypothetical protein A2096_04820 [Spirochaetes bacterium GWF1_41_5]
MPENFTAPKFLRTGEWQGYSNDMWHRKDKQKTTVLFGFIERRKTYFFKAYFDRNGYSCIDMGDHFKEDVNYGKRYGNRMQCNPLYFTTGALVKFLLDIERNTGLSKEEIADRYVFLGGGGQCGPCRYGMYPQEYLKAVNDAGFKSFRLLIFSSDIADLSQPKKSALKFNLLLRINMLIGIILADLMHAAECSLRAHARDTASALKAIEEAENILFAAFRKKFWIFHLPAALKKAGKILAAVERYGRRLPLIFITGEFFANLAHNDGNYNLRRFVSDEGCEAIPGLMTQRVLYDNWRRTQEGRLGVKYAADRKEKRKFRKSLRKQKTADFFIIFFWNWYSSLINMNGFGGRAHLIDLDHLSALARDYYHPHIFGGESNLEVAEAIFYADKVEGFISSKPFGCMPSSGVSDGVQTKIMAMYPSLNFLSIETSGDNEVNILSRVSMLLFKAKQKTWAKG